MAAPRPVDEVWERRVAELWAAFDDREPAIFLADMRSLIAELPLDHPAALFELASAHDALGQEAEAEPLYRAALEGGLDTFRRRRAVIQLGSTLRNLGRAKEAVALLHHRAWPGPPAGRRSKMGLPRWMEPVTPLGAAAAAAAAAAAGVMTGALYTGRGPV